MSNPDEVVFAKISKTFIRDLKSVMNFSNEQIKGELMYMMSLELEKSIDRLLKEVDREDANSREHVRNIQRQEEEALGITDEENWT
jgi:hypothetical protein